MSHEHHQAHSHPISHHMHAKTMLDIIKERRSIRRYQDKEIAWGLVIHLIQAGQYAPSAGNLQNWKFIIIRNLSTREKIADACHQQDWMKDAPVHIIIVGEPSPAAHFYGARGETLYTSQNCAAVIQNMALVAHELNLGTCWVGAWDEDKLASILGFPENVACQGILTVGFPAEHPPVPLRKRMKEIVFVEGWGDKGYGDKAKGYKSAVIKEAVQDVRGHAQRLGKRWKN
ncbi:nitroreductase family protein [Candidatus Woesearchaeota archaeon]|nr:nitroreductase family protein [Candidatus Woesearchaeota archaeon]